MVADFPTLGAAEQLNADLILQSVDLLQQGRRRNVKLVGSFGKAAAFGYCQKSIQSFVVHKTISLPLKMEMLLYAPHLSSEVLLALLQPGDHVDLLGTGALALTAGDAVSCHAALFSQSSILSVPLLQLAP